jgi:signal transduction histidine kinase/CheY-like chemotaxis protein
VKNQSTPAAAPAPRNKFWQLNTFIVMALACNAINFGYNVVDGMFWSAVIEVIGVCMLCFFMLLNAKGHYELPKLLSIIFANLHSFFLCYVQGTSQGSYLYLFPFVMAMIFFLRVRKNDLAVIAFLGATTLILLASVLFLPYRSRIDLVSDSVNYHHLALNIIINFILVIIFFYFVLRLLDAKEQKSKSAAAAKTRFMSNMSHELRTPLNAIIGTTHLLGQDQQELQESDHFKVLKNSSEHMLQLVNAVLDFSKLDEGKLEFVQEPFDLAPVLQQAADSFATVVRQKNIRLFLDIDGLPDGKKVIGDAMRLKQIFLNLLSNAVKFTETGSVTLRARVDHSTEANAMIYFSVTDTGIGIPAEKIHLIFESFTQADAETTRKYGGSGLGLSICRELVKKMGGELRVTSETGKGSSFYFSLTLPFPQWVTIIPKEKLQGPKNLNGISILLVEDNVVNMKIARRFLLSWGASIQTAENGEVAWELFRHGSYDLLLVDLEMPLMDGKELLALVRTIDKDIPAIAFTAAVYENMYDDLQQHGFNGYLHKPFRPDEMHSNILQHLRV